MMAQVKQLLGIEDARAREYRQYAVDCANLFERNPEGQRLWKRFRGVLEASSFVQGQPDTTAVNEGKRAFVREIANAIEYYHTGMKEETKVLTERPRVDDV